MVTVFQFLGSNPASGLRALTPARFEGLLEWLARKLGATQGLGRAASEESWEYFNAAV